MLMTRLYTLAVNEQAIVAIDMDVPDWLPVRPRLNRCWLRGLISAALRRYFAARARI